MAITTFGTLKTALENWLGDSSTLTSRIPEFVSLAEDDIGMDLRTRDLEASADLTINAQTVALSTGYLQAKRLYLSGNPVKPLDYLPAVDFWSRYMSTNGGKPAAFTIEGENFVFGPSPDTTYTGKLLYYKRPTAFSTDADTNTILTTKRGLYLYGALKHASLYLEDPEKARFWEALYQQLIDKAHKADAKDRHSGAPLQSRSQYYGG
jgi:hypothetical protein